ncbi:MAG TPA: cytochrome c [Candidatus Methylacidiphilales bacterium]|nr:cytochrome c [Candidatus Methylacidiphilales bacterium]
MNPPLEIKALGLALAVASVSLGGALLAAIPVQWIMKPDHDAAQSAPTVSSPERASSPALVRQGRQFFAMTCASCHGDDAHGDEGPDLRNLAISNARIAVTIKKGVKGEMPNFSKKYDDAQVSALVAYLRSLR